MRGLFALARPGGNAEHGKRFALPVILANMRNGLQAGGNDHDQQKNRAKTGQSKA